MALNIIHNISEEKDKIPRNLRLPNFKVELEFTNKDIAVAEQGVAHLIPKGISSSAFQRAWDEGFTGKDVIIAIIDTGIDSSHPDLKGTVIKSVNLTNEPLTESHGTHVCGTIAAHGWLMGGAYDAKIIDIKVIGRNGGSIDNIVKAIGLATTSGASIISMSLGGSGLPTSDINNLTTAIQNAWNKGTICIAAAGNDGTSVCTPDVYEYPASINNTQSIAACNIDEGLNDISLAYFSNENNRVTMSACGVNVASTIIGGKYAVYSGTSMATPHVSAMAAILTQYIRSKYPTLSGSSFSSALVSLLHYNALQVNACGVKSSVFVGDKPLLHQTVQQPCPSSQTISSSSANVQYQNISFGLGYLRYEPTKGPVIPNGNKFYNNNIFLGHITK